MRSTSWLKDAPLLLALLVHWAAAVMHVDVFWNSTNELFEPFEGAIDSPGFYELSARARDVVHFHCPRRRANEFSIIHKVPREDFVRCALSESAEKVVTCDGSRVHHQHALEHSSTGYIYFVSTSNGSIEGLENRRMGLCLEKNMRLAVQLGEVSTKREMSVPIPGRPDLYLAEENGELQWKMNVRPLVRSSEELGDFKMLREDLRRQDEPNELDGLLPRRIGFSPHLQPSLPSEGKSAAFLTSSVLLLWTTSIHVSQFLLAPL